MRPASPRLGNILVLTPAGTGRFHHARALRRHCDNVFEFDFIETCRRLGIVATRALIARTLAEKKIDVFFVTLYWDNYLVPLEFFLELRKTVRIVLVSCDDESGFDAHSRYYAQAVDAVITTDYFSVEAYRALGVPAILCLTSISKDMYPALGAVRDIDVSFVGNCDKSDRKQYLEYLSANGIAVSSFGFGSRGGFISDTEMAGVFCRTKVNLSFSRLEGGRSPGDRTTGNKGRTIEVAMTRSFCLSEYYPALPHVFEIGKEIDCFSDRHSLLEKVRYYLSHEAERERIAASAYDRALRDYEDVPYFDKVVSELAAAFSRLETEPPRTGLILKSREFKISHIADLVVHGLSLLLRRQFGPCAEVAAECLQYGPAIFLVGAARGMARSSAYLVRKLL